MKHTSVDLSGQQVVRGCDGVDIAGEVKIEVLLIAQGVSDACDSTKLCCGPVSHHWNHLRIAAALSESVNESLGMATKILISRVTGFTYRGASFDAKCGSLRRLTDARKHLIKET